jgi:UDP-glucose 4-epimerase
VFVSSGGTVYGQPVFLPISEDHRTDPISPYGVAKLTIEKFIQLACRAGGLKATIARLSNPFGIGQAIAKRQGIVATFAYAIATGRHLEVWGDGTVVRDYIAISDTVTALSRCVGQDEPFDKSLSELLDHYRAVGGDE